MLSDILIKLQLEADIDVLFLSTEPPRLDPKLPKLRLCSSNFDPLNHYLSTFKQVLVEARLHPHKILGCQDPALETEVRVYCGQIIHPADLQQLLWTYKPILSLTLQALKQMEVSGLPEFEAKKIDFEHVVSLIREKAGMDLPCGSEMLAGWEALQKEFILPYLTLGKVHSSAGLVIDSSLFLRCSQQDLLEDIDNIEENASATLHPFVFRNLGQSLGLKTQSLGSSKMKDYLAGCSFDALIRCFDTVTFKKINFTYDEFLDMRKQKGQKVHLVYANACLEKSPNLYAKLGVHLPAGLLPLSDRDMFSYLQKPFGRLHSYSVDIRKISSKQSIRLSCFTSFCYLLSESASANSTPTSAKTVKKASVVWYLSNDPAILDYELHKIYKEEAYKSLNWLLSQKIRFYKTVQKPGDLLVIPPGYYYWNTCQGDDCVLVSWNVCYKSLPQMIALQKAAVKEELNSTRFPMTRMIVSWLVAECEDLSLELVHEANNLVRPALREENEFIKGVIQLKKEQPGEIAQNTTLDEDCDYFCDLCRCQFYNISYASSHSRQPKSDPGLNQSEESNNRQTNSYFQESTNISQETDSPKRLCIKCWEHRKTEFKVEDEWVLEARTEPMYLAYFLELVRLKAEGHKVDLIKIRDLLAEGSIGNVQIKDRFVSYDYLFKEHVDLSRAPTSLERDIRLNHANSALHFFQKIVAESDSPQDIEKIKLLVYLRSCLSESDVKSAIKKLMQGSFRLNNLSQVALNLLRPIQIRN